MQFAKFIAVAATVVALAGCDAAGSRRAAYIRSNPFLSPVFSEAISNGRVLRGMDTAMVRAVRGTPDRKRSGFHGGFRSETWFYEFGTSDCVLVFFEDGLVTGWEEFR